MPIDYTYTPGGASLTTQGSGSSGMSGVPDMSWLLEQARIKADREAAYRAAEEERKARLFEMQAATFRRSQQPDERAAPSGLDALRNEAEAAKLKALTEPPPMLTTPGGFDNPSHLEMDVQHMTAPQRQAFLPQNAGVSNNGMSAGEEAKAKAEAEMLVMREWAQQRKEG